MTSKKKIVISVISFITLVAVIVLAIILNINNQYSQKVKQGDILVANGKYQEANVAYEQASNTKTTTAIQSKIESTTVAIGLSSMNYDTAMKAFNAKDYSTAIDNFKIVNNKDSKEYATASDKMKQAIKLEDDSAIKDAQGEANGGDYASAIQSINTAMSSDATNIQLINLKTTYTNDQVNADNEAQAKATAKADADAKAKAYAEAQAQAKATAEAQAQQATADANAKATAKATGVTIGMTTQQCIDSSWGRPESINRTTTASDVSEQWVYGDSTSFLYFDNGILTDIQN